MVLSVAKNSAIEFVTHHHLWINSFYLPVVQVVPLSASNAAPISFKPQLDDRPGDALIPFEVTTGCFPIGRHEMLLPACQCQEALVEDSKGSTESLTFERIVYGRLFSSE